MRCCRVCGTDRLCVECLSINECVAPRKHDEVLRDLRRWGVEHDDARFDYVTVQIDRIDIDALDGALREEET